MGGELRDILYIEIDSIRFCTPEMLEKFNDLCFNWKFFWKKQTEIDLYNQEYYFNSTPYRTATDKPTFTFSGSMPETTWSAIPRSIKIWLYWSDFCRWPLRNSLLRSLCLQLQPDPNQLREYPDWYFWSYYSGTTGIQFTGFPGTFGPRLSIAKKFMIDRIMKTWNFADK